MSLPKNKLKKDNIDNKITSGNKNKKDNIGDFIENELKMFEKQFNNKDQDPMINFSKNTNNLTNLNNINPLKHQNANASAAKNILPNQKIVLNSKNLRNTNTLNLGSFNLKRTSDQPIIPNNQIGLMTINFF